MDGVAVSTEARIALRRYRERSGARWVRLKSALGGAELHGLATDFALGSRLKARRAFGLLDRRLVGAMLVEGDVTSRAAAWVCPVPHAEVPGAPEGTWRQGGVALMELVIRRDGGRSKVSRKPIAEISDHALGRLLQRAPLHVDIDAVLVDLCRQIRAKRVTMVEGGRACLISAGPGYFLAEQKAVRDPVDGARVFLRASTWFSKDDRLRSEFAAALAAAEQTPAAGTAPQPAPAAAR